MADARHRSMSNAPKFADRTYEQREADARANGPMIRRARVVGSMLTARYLKAKSIFDKYHEYDVDQAFVPTTTGEPCWREDADPWLRIRDTLPEFLGDYTRIIVESGGEITGEGLQNLAVALVRVARAEWEGAGRDKEALGGAFERDMLALVGRLQAEFKLPEAPDADDDGEEEGEGEGDRVGEGDKVVDGKA